MTTVSSQALIRLIERNPSISGAEIASELSPPPQFEHASFESYRPDPDFPSQQAALERLKEFAGAWRAAQRPGGFFSRKRPARIELPGVYLDGGFGVGKTHLLAALWHVAHGPKYFGTFIEYTALVGALGYQPAVELLRGAKLVCIDEFELDDPGDTMLMTRFLGELMAGGTRVAATSNTPPNALGEGRFAASDFLREIHALSSNFETLRIDGLDYRRRDTEGHAESLAGDADVARTAAALAARGHRVSLDGFDELIAHLATVHPSKYVKLVAGLEFIALEGVHELTDQNAALRLVAFIDRVYDAEVPIIASGLPLDEVFAADMMAGGYRKKYLRAMSRMIALTTGELPPHD
ncbi:cell division protein ZapE [Agromyces badenianii]|uniref:Cell division protein ZapE n=1 Tax=Agromyces badenianii TaxID=2080742 RepID=A0A2S0WWF4_9MICO|nr:cell division protein ZapE [Agromyces badenianii]AWB95675.1 cell division protein ZapE [Agromyces badenianii]PWC04029.1 cell division protein ZapE [Agromyces badenianii]